MTLVHELMNETVEQRRAIAGLKDALAAREAEVARLAAVETAARAMTTHYDECEECQDQGSCAEACDLWEAVKAALAAPPPGDGANPWRAEFDARIERYVAAFSINPNTLTTDEEWQRWQRTRARLEQDAKDALYCYAFREAKNRNGIISDTPAPPGDGAGGGEAQ